MSVTVIASPEAEQQIKAIDQWWKENRKAAPNLFIDELSDAVAILQEMPLMGHRSGHPEVKSLRRVLLRATRYHIYYIAEQETVYGLAIWSAIRGAGPDLKRLPH
jgi:plasmid stabilization system protein ParE